MGTRYSATAVSGYNSSPPSDDGSTAASNQGFWSTIKTKLGDPLNTFASALDGKLATAFDYSARSITTSDNTVAGDHMKTVQIASTVSTAITVSLGDATSMAAGYIVTVSNQSAISQTVGRVTSSNGINGATSNITLPTLCSATFKVNAAATGYNMEAQSANGTFSTTLSGGISKNLCYNSGCRVQAGAAVNLSTSAQYGKCDSWAVWASGGAVSAGTVTLDTAASIGTYARALHASGITLTGAGVMSFRQRIPAIDAIFAKNKTYTFSAWVLHDVGSSINYTVVIRKPTVADNYGGVTTIGTSSATSVSTGTATQITFTQALGDCSNGLEIEIQAACGAITTKNFRCSDFQLEEGSSATELMQTHVNEDTIRCQYLYRKSYEQGTDPATSTALGARGQATPGFSSTIGQFCDVSFDYPMRVNSGTITLYSTTGASGNWRNLFAGSDQSVTAVSPSTRGFLVNVNATPSQMSLFGHYTVDCRL